MDALPFTPRQFFDLMGEYNLAMWPVPPLLWLAAAAVFALLARRGPRASRLVAGFLALLWAWMALAYHAAFFTRINPLAPAFAVAFGAAAVVFAWEGVLRGRMSFEIGTSLRNLPGVALVAVALLAYPLAALLAGHEFPETPTFGLPCPTTLYTVGLLALMRRPFPRIVIVVPTAWSLLGASAAWLLGVPEDLSLLPAALVGAWLLATASSDGTPTRSAAGDQQIAGHPPS